MKDSAEGIATIDWTVYGKIKSVTHRIGFYRLNGTDTLRPPDLLFNYDAAGNRISKVSTYDDKYHIFLYGEQPKKETTIQAAPGNSGNN